MPKNKTAREDKRMFVPCPECKTRAYEYDTATVDDESGKYLFNFKCGNCGNIYNDALNLSKKDDQADFMKDIMNPSALAKIVKKVQGELTDE